MLSEVKARYVVGLTATPYRRDGHQAIISSPMRSGDGGQMVAFIHYDLSITGDQVRDFMFADQALDHGYVQETGRLTLP